MKGNKKILVVAVLLLLISVSFTTYAIYRNSISGSGSATAAAWTVDFQKGGSSVSDSFNFSGSDVTWTVNPSAVAGKIAPGATGYIDYQIVATGTEVDVYYNAELLSGGTSGITVSLTDTSGNALSGEQLLQYNSTAMTATVRINITWDGTTSDQPSKDTADLGIKDAGSISIPIKFTARQSVENKTGVSS